VDLATGTPIRKPPVRRYEHPKPGALAHVDIKKLGRIPRRRRMARARQPDLVVPRLRRKQGQAVFSGLRRRRSPGCVGDRAEAPDSSAALTAKSDPQLLGRQHEEALSLDHRQHTWK
jgi:hypothetical protein